MNIKDLKQTDYKVVQPKLNINNLSPEVVRVLGASSQQSQQPEGNTGIFGPAKDAIQGLQTLYGGGEQGIAQKLASDVQAGAQDMSQGNFVKGALKSGGRVAGDVAGAIFAPVGAALQATGINRLFDKAGSAIAESSLVNKITDIPAVQNFASAHPNAGEDFSRVLNLAMSGGGGDITVKGLKEVAMLPKDIAMATPSAIKSVLPTKESVAQERQAKLNQGFAEQNVRLKSAGKSFSDNTKTYTDPTTKNKVTVTPIDTFAEHNIAPIVEKGTIKMGDWKTGEGELGKIKNAVDTIDTQVDTILTDSQKLHPIDQLEQYTIAKIKANSDLQAAGKVNSTVAKLKNVFEDYRGSYGDEITTTQMNEIRKVMNRDWNPDTVDASRAVGDVAREIVYNATPDLKVKELLRKEGELLAAKKYAETINGTKVVGGRLGNMAMRTAGAIMGATIEKAPVIGPVVGMIGGEYAARALQQSQFKSAWTELKALIQSNKTEPSQSANSIPKSAISSKYTPQSVKDVGNPMPTATKAVKDYVKNPKLGLSMEDVSKNLSVQQQGMKDSVLKIAKEQNIPITKDGNLVLYHGTKEGRAPKNGDTWRVGSYFTSSEKVARQFAGQGEGGAIKIMKVEVPPQTIFNSGDGTYFTLNEKIPVKEVYGGISPISPPQNLNIKPSENVKALFFQSESMSDFLRKVKASGESLTQKEAESIYDNLTAGKPKFSPQVQRLLNMQ